MESPPQITLIELLVDNEEPEDTDTYWVTEHIHVRVPRDIDDDLFLAVVEAIAGC